MASYFYKDLQGEVYGPFIKRQIDEWNEAGYLDPHLLVKLDTETDYTPLCERSEFRQSVPSAETPDTKTTTSEENQPEPSESSTLINKNEISHQCFRCKCCGSIGTKEADNYPQPHYWYYDLGGTPYGPFTFRKVAEWFAARYFGPKTLIARCVHDTDGALVAIMENEANTTINGEATTDKQHSDKVDSDIPEEDESESQTDSIEEEEEETTEKKDAELQGTSKISATVVASKEWLAKQFKEKIKAKENEGRRTHQKKEHKKGQQKTIFYKVPPKECFVEARRYPEFAIYLSEGVQTGRYSQVTPGPQNKTIPVRDTNLIQDVATEIVQRIYNISKQVEEAKRENGEKQEEPKEQPQQIPLPDVPAPHIVIPTTYQDYTACAAFNALTGKFEGNPSNIYDYRLAAQMNGSLVGMKAAEDFANATEKTQNAINYGVVPGQGIVYNRADRQIAKYMDLDKYQEEMRQLQQSEEAARIAEAKRRAKKRQRRRQREREAQNNE